MATSAERLAEYEKLFDVAQSYDPTAYQKEFEKTYNENMNYNQDLINQQSTALAELQNIAPTLRQKYASSLIKDPTLQRSLISSARQTPITDYSNATNLLTARGNKYSDILASALGAYQTAADKAQAAAESAWNMYTQQVAIEEAARNRAASSSGLSIKDIIDLINGSDTSTTEEGEDEYKIPVQTVSRDLLTQLPTEDVSGIYKGGAGTAGASIARAREEGGSFGDYLRNYYSGGGRIWNPVYGLSYGGAALSDLIGNLFNRNK